MVSLNFTINIKFNLCRNAKHRNEVNLKLQELIICVHIINIMVVLIVFRVKVRVSVNAVICCQCGR